MDSNASQDGRYAPPQAEVADVGPGEGSGALATRGTRLGAAIVDGLLAAALMWVASKITPWNPWDVAGFSYWQPQPAMNLVGGVLLFLLPHGYLLLTQGQTIGKYLLKIRIVRTDGSKAGPDKLALRYGVGFVATILPATGQIWGILDCLFIFRASRKCLHDSIADTIVVKI